MVRRRSSLLIFLLLPGTDADTWAVRSADGVVGGVALVCARRVDTIVRGSLR